MNENKFRLVTRADFDGVVCGGLFIEMEMIGDIAFAEPKEMQDGDVEIGPGDITANLPYVDGVHLCFDHHLSETVRVGARDNLIIDAAAPSAARVVYDHYGGAAAFPGISDEMMAAVDQADSAQYSEADILAPDGWTLINFILDPRSGLSRFDRFAIPHDEWVKDMMTYCRHHPVDEILLIPDVEERLHLFMEHEEAAEMQIRRRAREQGNTVVVDLRGEESIFCCNRFLVYALFPEASVSIQILPAPRPGRAILAMGKSILKRTSKANLGLLALDHGGGGHEAAATCRADDAEVDAVLGRLIEAINADGG